MQNEEKIVLVLGALAIVAVILFQVKTPKTLAEEIAPAESQPVDEETAAGGPAYLTYNQPYIWGPPVNNFLPPINIA